MVKRDEDDSGACQFAAINALEETEAIPFGFAFDYGCGDYHTEKC